MVVVVCRHCATQNADPGPQVLDLSGWACGHCGYRALERRLVVHPIHVAQQAPDPTTVATITGFGAVIGGIVGGPPGAIIGGILGLAASTLANRR